MDRMNSYEQLINYADGLGLEVVEKEFRSSAKGLCKGNKIGISKNIDTTVEKRCILAEEIAHCLYTSGDILDTREQDAMMQEEYARRQAYEMLLPLRKLLDAYYYCCENLHLIPEHLDVTEEFLAGALQHYARKYGGFTRHGRYIIYFMPFFITESDRLFNAM